MRAGAGGLARVALHDDAARHHVLGDARAGVAKQAHGRALVHASAVVADVSVDLDLRIGVHAAGDGVRPVRVLHAPARGAAHVVGKVVEPLV